MNNKTTREEFINKWTELLRDAMIFSADLESQRKREGWRGSHCRNMAAYLWDKQEKQ